MYRQIQRPLQGIGKRQFSSHFARLNEAVKGAPTPVPVVKKSHPFRKFFIRVGLFTSVIYLGGIALALKSDTIYDNFVDYFPMGEELVEFAENYLINYNYSGNSSAKSDLHSFNASLDKTVPVVKAGVLSSTISQEELANIEAHKEKVRINVTDKTAGHSPETALPLVEFKSLDESLNKTISSLNDLIKSINHDAPVHASLISTISDHVKELSEKLGSIAQSHTVEMSKLDQDQLSVISQEKEVELTKKFLQQFDAERENLEKKYHEILINEIEATKSKIFLQADNKIDSVRLMQLEEFNKLVSKKIETERDGKLAKLDQIYDKISKLEAIESEMSDQISHYLTLKNLKIELGKVESTLIDSDTPIILNSQFVKLQSLALELKDELLLESIKQLPKSGNLLTKQQLISRWKLLAPELRAASLLPPNAGILGHFASRVLSKFLFAKQGFAEGNDMESIISRVNGYLERDELDLAVEQVASLKGWSRRLADDWVVESRKRLEVEFLIKVIDYEARLLA